MREVEGNERLEDVEDVQVRDIGVKEEWNDKVGGKGSTQTPRPRRFHAPHRPRVPRAATRAPFRVDSCPLTHSACFWRSERKGSPTPGLAWLGSRLRSMWDAANRAGISTAGPFQRLRVGEGSVRDGDRRIRARARGARKRCCTTQTRHSATARQWDGRVAQQRCSARPPGWSDLGTATPQTPRKPFHPLEMAPSTRHSARFMHYACTMHFIPVQTLSPELLLHACMMRCGHDLIFLMAVVADYLPRAPE